MGTINSNIASLIAQRALLNASNETSTTLQRLSTGLRINSAADDPAGLIASLSLGNEQTGINAALANAQQAGNMLGTADARSTRSAPCLRSFRVWSSNPPTSAL